MGMGMLGDQLPFIKLAEGLIGIWSIDAEGMSDGFIMNPAAAEIAALRLLATAQGAKGDGREGTKTSWPNAIATEIAQPVSEDMAARIVFEFDGATLAFALNALQVSELAAALTALAIEVG